MPAHVASILESIVSGEREATYVMHALIRLAELEEKPSHLDGNVPRQQLGVAEQALSRLAGVEAVLGRLRDHFEAQARKADAILAAQDKEEALKHNTTVRAVSSRDREWWWAAECSCEWAGAARLKKSAAIQDAENHRKPLTEALRGTLVVEPDPEFALAEGGETGEEEEEEDWGEGRGFDDDEGWEDEDDDDDEEEWYDHDDEDD